MSTKLSEIETGIVSLDAFPAEAGSGVGDANGYTINCTGLSGDSISYLRVCLHAQFDSSVGNDDLTITIAGEEVQTYEYDAPTDNNEYVRYAADIIYDPATYIMYIDKIFTTDRGDTTTVGSMTIHTSMSALESSFSIVVAAATADLDTADSAYMVMGCGVV